MEIALFVHFKEYHENHKKFKSLYDFGGRCLQIRDVSMDFEQSLVSVHPKNLRQITARGSLQHGRLCRVQWNSHRLVKQETEEKRREEKKHKAAKKEKGLDETQFVHFLLFVFSISVDYRWNVQHSRTIINLFWQWNY